MLRKHRRTAAIAALSILFVLGFVFAGLPAVQGDTFGSTSLSGMGTYAGDLYILFAKYTATTSGPLSSISLAATGGTGNVAIYADNSGSPGSLMAQGTTQTLSNGWNTFSSLSASATIVASTNYWLAFEMSSGSFYYADSGGPGGYGLVSTCCNMPATIAVTTIFAHRTYGVYATYATGPSTYGFNVRTGATQVVVTVSWAGTPGTTSVSIAGPGGTPTLSESGAVVYDRVSYVTGSSTPTNIHRVTFSVTGQPTGTWTAYVSQTGAAVTIEVS